MTLLRGCILWSLFRGVGATLVAIVAITACIELVGQLNDVGLGDYGMREALIYVALRIPAPCSGPCPLPRSSVRC